MANPIDEAFVEIVPDFSKFNREVSRGVQKASSELQTGFSRAVNSVESDFNGIASEASSSFSRVESDASSAASSMEAEFTAAAGGVEAEFASAAASIEADFSSAVADIKSALSGLESTIGDSFSDLTDALSGVKSQSEDTGSSIIGSMKGAAGAAGIGAAIGAAVALGAALVDAAKESLALEGALNRAANAANIGPGGVDQFRDVVQDLQNEFGILSDQSVPALQAAISQGIPPDNIASFLETASQASIASGQDLTETVLSINGLMSSYPDLFDNATQATDFFTAAMSNSTADASDFRDGLGELSVFARDAGLSAADLGGIFAAASSTGRDTGTVIGQMAALVEELGDSTTPVAEAFTELSGKSFQEFIAGGGNVQQAAQLIADGAKEAGDSIVSFIGSVESTSAIGALIGEGAKRYEDGAQDIINSNDATAESFGQIEDSGALAFSQLEGSLETLKQEAGAAVAPFITAIIDDLLPVIQDDLVPIFEDLGGIIGPAFEAVGPFIQIVIDLLQTLFGILEPFMPVIQLLFEVLGAIGEVVGAILAPAFELLSAILTPLFEFIAAILTPVLEFLIDVFRQFADMLNVEVIKGALSILLSVIGEKVIPIITKFRDTTQKVIAVVSTTFNTFKSTASGVFNSIRNTVNSVTDGIKSAWDRTINFFKGLPGRIRSATSGMWDGIKNAFRSAINFVIDGWNSISFTVPSVDLGPLGSFGGFTIGTPNIPRLQTGGFTPNTTGEIPAFLHANEMVLPLNNQRGIDALSRALEVAGAGGTGNIVVNVRIGERDITDMISTEIKRDNQRTVRRLRSGTGRV